MTTIRLPTEFKNFFQLLDSHGVKYLLIGGWAVGYYGYPKATGDIDIWLAIDSKNQKNLQKALVDFGITLSEVNENLLKKGEFIRIGNPPLRIELLTEISGVQFEDCFERHVSQTIDGVSLKIINLEDLKKNKQASGRHKDLDDLENLPKTH